MCQGPVGHKQASGNPSRCRQENAGAKQRPSLLLESIHTNARDVVRVAKASFLRPTEFMPSRRLSKSRQLLGRSVAVRINDLRTSFPRTVARTVEISCRTRIRRAHEPSQRASMKAFLAPKPVKQAAFFQVRECLLQSYRALAHPIPSVRITRRQVCVGLSDQYLNQLVC